jgi:hypothetical protein
MRLIPERPVTVERARYAERWFPYLYRMPDGLLLMALQYNIDVNFSPWYWQQSSDGGRTWAYPVDHVPRLCWWHGFQNGELFVIDSYGVQDPQAPGEAVYYGAWYAPGRPNDVPRKGLVRVRNTQQGQSVQDTPGLTKFPWWPLWNEIHGNPGWGEYIWGGHEQIILTGPYFTDIVELPDGRLLAAGYRSHVAIYESADRGATWDEVGTIAIPPGEHQWVGNETALRRLPDGRLYAVIRVDGQPWTLVGPFHHSWSEDDGRTWSTPEPLTLLDEPDHTVGCAWPRLAALADGTLVLAYGRPGKHVIVDPSGTGTHWQNRLNLHAWELDTQALNGVPADQRLRGMVGVDWQTRWDRHTDSGDYLGIVATGPDELLVVYDVHQYVENWNAYPFNGVRMARVRVEG